MKKSKLMFTLCLCIGMASVPQFSLAQASEATAPAQLKQAQSKYRSYIPTRYILFDVVEGDLNKDGIKDAVLIVKGTDAKQWVVNSFDQKVDRNRRGIIVLLGEKGKYKPLMQNLSCFSSENEEGGVYFAPELYVEIKKNQLFINYGHGRYGWWGYSFRIEGQDLRMIGSDSSSNHGPYVASETSINFLTGKKLLRKNTNDDMDAAPRFKETWTTFKRAPIYLSKIKDFDELDFYDL